MFESITDLLAEYAELERRLADPAVHADQNEARRLGRRYSELSQVAEAHRAWSRAAEDVTAAEELAAEDESFRAEIPALAAHAHELSDKLRDLLLPRDPNDDKDVIVEIKAGEGGEESALFAGDLLRMYQRYAERQGWKTEILEAMESGLGGFKDVALAVKSRASAPGGVWSRLKYEGGVHRVQRVPVTESQGRIHTSAAGVYVLPEAEDVDVELNPADLRVDVFRSSGPGGQSVNTTDSAVRLTHLPTGIVVSCQNEKSQLQNKEQAMRIMRARLLAAAQEEADKEASDARKSQLRTVDRSERIRTYNYPENRIADHRVNFKAYNLPENRISDPRTGYKAYHLDHVLDGDLQPLLDSCVDTDMAARLAALED